jgi:hypothetical protein
MIFWNFKDETTSEVVQDDDSATDYQIHDVSSQELFAGPHPKCAACSPHPHVLIL